jgi:hypothetical protein
METDRHGYCEHNRRDHKCWECQAQRARAAELRVAELEGERDTVVELASRLEVDIESLNQTDTELTAKVAELQAQLDRANRRLSEYECPQHDAPKFGECDGCDRHNPEPKEVLGPWS